MGYDARFYRIPAANFVAQLRPRIFLIASMDPLPADLATLPKSPAGTLRDAIGSLPRDKAMSLGCAPFSPRFVRLYRGQPDGTKWTARRGDALRETLELWGTDVPENHVGMRLSWDRPCPTLLTGPSNSTSTLFVHPQEERLLSVYEFQVIMGVRDDDGLVLCGPLASKYRQLGQGVCPAVAEFIGGAFSGRNEQSGAPAADLGAIPQDLRDAA
jgi:site-specific DNA-cytosine methylase